MPDYEYICDNCGDNFEIFQKMSENPKKKCKKCNKYTLRRIFHAPILAKNNEPKTLGSLAERNSNKFSDDYKLKLYNQHRAQKRRELKLPDGAIRQEHSNENPLFEGSSKTPEEISRMTPTQKKNYIETGDK
jgi:putative FmdB family regulatory protein